MQKIRNCALRKLDLTNFYHPIKYIYKDHKIFKFTDILKVQSCLFMYEVEHSNALANTFPTLHSRDKHNYQTRPAT